jgi:hypothetical protein
MAVQGNLKDIGLSSLISVNCNEMNKAHLLVRRQDEQASIYFEDGNIVHASMNNLEGEDVLYKLLHWEDGDFTLEQGVAAPKQTVKKAWSGILLEGMRRIDEWDLDLELDLDNEPTLEDTPWDDSVIQIHHDLCRVAGVKDVRIIDIEGNVFPLTDPESEKQELSAIAFIFQRGKAIANMLGEKVVQSVLYTQETGRCLIFCYEGGVFSAHLSEKASAPEVIEAFRKIQARHQT